jgi:hypothetical protein
VHAVSQRAWGLRLRRVCGGLAIFAPASVWPSPSVHGVGTLNFFTKLDTRPTDASCLRFDGGLATATARLEVRWFATPSLQDSFIPYCMPVYPGARTERYDPRREIRSRPHLLSIWQDSLAPWPSVWRITSPNAASTTSASSWDSDRLTYFDCPACPRMNAGSFDVHIHSVYTSDVNQ